MSKENLIHETSEIIQKDKKIFNLNMNNFQKYNAVLWKTRISQHWHLVWFWAQHQLLRLASKVDEDHDCWDASNSILGCNWRTIFSTQFEALELPIILLWQFNYWMDHMAWPTPWSPKLNQNRPISLEDKLYYSQYLALSLHYYFLILKKKKKNPPMCGYWPQPVRNLVVPNKNG